MPLSDLISVLFVPAMVGILGQVIWGADSSHQVLALAIFLMGFEQAYMATVDLQRIEAVKQRVKDPRLVRFEAVTHSTIAIELVGFYLAAFWPGWGGLVLLLSQIWFNSLAGLQLHPATEEPIRPWGISQRRAVLLADGIGLVCMALWLAHIASLGIAIGLLVLVLIYGIAKYVLHY